MVFVQVYIFLVIVNQFHPNLSEFQQDHRLKVALVQHFSQMDELKMPLSLNPMLFFYLKKSHEKVGGHTATPNIVFPRIQCIISEYKQMVPPFLLYLNTA